MRSTLDQACPLAARLRGAAGACVLGVLVVGGHDPLDELVADHVLAAEAHELDALHVLEDVADHDAGRCAGRAAGRSGSHCRSPPSSTRTPSGSGTSSSAGRGVLPLVEDDGRSFSVLCVSSISSVT